MATNLIAKSSITINAPITKVWDALVNPILIKQYMFGTEVVSTWQEHSPIVWKGIWKDKSYEDKGIILKLLPEKTLQFTHYSPLAGTPDVPESYHTVTYELLEVAGQTEVSLTQDNNGTEEEVKHSEGVWTTVLTSLKKLLET